jgi:hypothetical protein
MNAINKIPADPYDVITEILRGYGISICAGVTGGGIIHFTKKMEPYRKLRNREILSFFNVGEYAAGFLPLGYYLATGTVAAAAATTGARNQASGMWNYRRQTTQYSRAVHCPAFSRIRRRICSASG